MEKDVRRSQVYPEPPVPLRDHYEIMKWAEREVKEALKSIEEHEWLLVGLRVGYYVPLDDSEELGQEYKVECGYLEALDHAETTEVTEEEWRRTVEERRKDNPLPMEFMEALHKKVTGKLEEKAGQTLLAGVFGVLMGSGVRLLGVGCGCRFQRRWRRCYGTSCNCSSRCGSV